MDWTELASQLEDRADRDQFSGVVLITRDGSPIFSGAYGFASRAWKTPNTLDTRFDTASITKLFTSVVALQTVEKGMLHVNTRAVPLLGLENSAINPDVTLEHLLTHTSGMGDDADEEAGEDYADIWKERISYMVRETTDLLPQFVHKMPNFAPGEGCRYCNAGYILAGLMVEEVTGDRYRDRVSADVFDTAGMADSGFFAMDSIEPRVAEGADPVAGGWVRNIYSYPPIGSPDGGAHVTAGDLVRFLQALRHGHLLGEEWTRRFLEPVVRHSGDESGELHFGYGLEFRYDRKGDLIYMGKDGVNAGTSAVLRHYPSIETTVVVLSNMQDGAWQPAEMIHSALALRG